MDDFQISRLGTLKRARDIIAERKHWTKGYGALTSDGREVDVLSEEACAWCLLGALEKACLEHAEKHNHVRRAELMVGVCEDLLMEHIGQNHAFAVVNFNDKRSTTHEKVLEVLDKTIDGIDEE